MTTAPHAPAIMPRRGTGMPALSVPQRIAAAIVMLACAAMLITGVWLTPATAGHGTHVQLGLPPCGWKYATGTPCATCGMTTAVTHAAHGNLWASIKAQPFGFLIAVAAATGFWIALHGVITGSRVDKVLWWFLRARPLILIGLLFFAAWGYKYWADANGVV